MLFTFKFKLKPKQLPTIFKNTIIALNTRNGDRRLVVILIMNI